MTRGLTCPLGRSFLDDCGDWSETTHDENRLRDITRITRLGQNYRQIAH